MRGQAAFKSAELRPWRREVESQVLILPYPVSVNAMFNDGDIGHGKRPITPEYKRWKFLAETEIMHQRSGRVPGPVEVHFTMEEKPGRHDGDNLLKGIFDTLVKMGVIDGDHSKVVRGFSFRWGDVTGARVEIKRAPAPLDSPS